MRRDRHVPAGAALVEALAMGHQHAAARGVSALEEALELVRFHSAGQAELVVRRGRASAMRRCPRIAFGVVVPTRELALVVVAGLAGTERRRRAQHDDPGSRRGRSGQVRFPRLAGGICAAWERGQLGRATSLRGSEAS